MQLSKEVKIFAVTLQVIAIVLGLWLYVEGLGGTAVTSSVATVSRG